MLLVILSYGIPNRRIQQEISLAQTYANNRMVNDYYSSAVVQILHYKTALPRVEISSGIFSF